MKKWMLIVVFAALAAGAQVVEEYLAQVRVRVTDEAGVPIPKARVLVSTYNTWVPARQGAGRSEYDTEMRLTDTNGVATLSLKGSSGRYSCMVLPMPGFGYDRGKEYVFTNSVAGRWEPWSPQVNLVLKRTGSGEAPEVRPAEPKAPGPDVPKDPAIGRHELFPALPSQKGAR